MALLSEVNGIGPKMLELFNKLNIYTTDDLVNHYPFRYDVIGKSNISSLNDGQKHENRKAAVKEIHRSSSQFSFRCVQLRIEI